MWDEERVGAVAVTNEKVTRGLARIAELESLGRPINPAMWERGFLNACVAVQAEAADALGRIGDSKAILLLSRLAEVGEGRNGSTGLVRSNAIDALAALQAKEAIPLFLSALSTDRSYLVRICAVEALEDVSPAMPEIPHVVEALWDAARGDWHADVRAYAVRALAALASEKARSQLRELLTGEEHPFPRAWMLHALIGLGDDAASDQFQAHYRRIRSSTTRYVMRGWMTELGMPIPGR